MSEFFNSNNIFEAKKKHEEIISLIISDGQAETNPVVKEKLREELRQKIRNGEVTRDFLNLQGYPTDKILKVEEIVDFLIPLAEIPAIKKVEVARKMPVISEIEELGVTIKMVDETLLPSGSGEIPVGKSEPKESAEKKVIPRFEILVKFLKNNGITPEDYFCIEGKNQPDMVRTLSYRMFVLPSLGKLALVNNEEENATYVIHTAPSKEEYQKLLNDEETEENERSPEFYYRMTKQDLQILQKELGLTTRIKWDEDNWLAKLENELTRELENNFSAEKIKEILAIKQKKEQNRFFLPFVEAREKARELGFRGREDYQKKYKEISGLPGKPEEKYKNAGWVSWGDFLGTEREKQKPEELLPFTEAREKARAFGFESQEDYRERYKEMPGLPGNPSQTYKKKGWVSWGDFLGTGRPKAERQKTEDLLSFVEAREKARAFGFESQEDYKERYKQVPGLPGLPSEKYKDDGWVSLGDFLGTGRPKIERQKTKNILPFAEAREKARAFGFESQEDYEKRYKKIPGLPTHPERAYNGKGWISLGDFLGTGRPKAERQKTEDLLPFAEAREKARKFGFKDSKDYRRRYRKIPGLPCQPREKYQDAGWVDWADFLGKE